LSKKNFLNISTYEALLFCKLYETGNTTEVAQYLGVSTAQVSVGIGRLEKKLGDSPLFIRNRRQGKFVPTSAAEKIEQNMQCLVQFSREISDVQDSDDKHVSIKSTHTVLEHFLGPYVPSFFEENPDIRLGFKQDDELSFKKSSLNEILITCFPDENPLYQYIPYHSFQQKLWASPEYIDKYGNPTSVQELKAHRLLMRRITDDPRALFGSSFIKTQLGGGENIKLHDICSVRFIDILCERGCGIMASAEESVKLAKLKIEQVYQAFKGDEVTLYVCVSKDFLKRDTGKMVANWIFKCRNESFRTIGVTPSYAFTPLT
jgi:DNA-binding transcriptional LysR family regulator